MLEEFDIQRMGCWENFKIQGIVVKTHLLNSAEEKKTLATLTQVQNGYHGCHEQTSTCSCDSLGVVIGVMHHLTLLINVHLRLDIGVIMWFIP